MPQGNPKPGERYLHFKNKMYQIITLAHHSETDERLVVYQALYGDFGVCARPYDMFISEVDHEKYPDVTQKYRFTYVETENDQPYWAKEEAPKEEVEPVKEVPPIKIEVPEQPEVENPIVQEEQPTEVAEAKAAEISEEQEEGQANPWLMKFLDAETFDDKYEVLGQMYREIDDKLIDDIAVCMDVVVPAGNLQERYMQLKQCLRTRQKYEGTRL